MKINMKTKILICLSALLAVAATTNVIVGKFELPAAKVTIKVLDENQQPLANANVWLTFKDRVTFKDLNIRGLTGANGLFTGEGGCDASGVGCGITKDGYYMGSAPIPKFYGVDTDNHRQPWNETYTAILRPVGKTVALYAKKVQADVPVLDQPCGYDLEVGDWVAPYGKGFKADFIFKIHRDFKDQFNFKVEAEMTFKQPDDGLLPMTSPPVARNSFFRWERFAPEEGYNGSARNLYFINHDPRSGQKQEKNFDFVKRDQGHFFRVRTVKQEGKVVSAHYGKITGDIGMEPRDSTTCKIIFTYYFNPTPLDQNLEWDPKRNLFGGLTDMETPREP